MFQKLRASQPNGSRLVLHAQRRCFKVKVKQGQDHVNCVFDLDGVHHKYVPPGRTINKEYCLNVLHWLRDAIQQKWPQLRTTGDWQLHHDNAPTHASHLIQSVLVKHQIIQVTQAPYTPDFTPCDSGSVSYTHLTLPTN